MIQNIYIEEEILTHPTAQEICSRFPQKPLIPCKKYGEIFNRKNQSFRLQKQAPSLILAKKRGNLVLPTPEAYGIGGKNNYYFSHMLNCIFDCRYCFLQGMYRSANYVVFVNHEEFESALKETLLQHKKEEVYFFSGYDCDSLALEPITHFVERILPFFSQKEKAFLELRTKSTNIRFLLKQPPLPNCIVAFTLSPECVTNQIEHKTPSLKSRLDAIEELQKKGWPVGLRFDPLILMDDYQTIYKDFFDEVFSRVDANKIHSATLGTFRVPKQLFKNMIKEYPKEKLFAHSIKETSGLMMYEKSVERSLFSFCTKEILNHIDSVKFFPCEVEDEK